MDKPQSKEPMPNDGVDRLDSGKHLLHIDNAWDCDMVLEDYRTLSPIEYSQAKGLSDKLCAIVESTETNRLAVIKALADICDGQATGWAENNSASPWLDWCELENTLRCLFRGFEHDARKVWSGDILTANGGMCYFYRVLARVIDWEIAEEDDFFVRSFDLALGGYSIVNEATETVGEEA